MNHEEMGCRVELGWERGVEGKSDDGSSGKWVDDDCPTTRKNGIKNKKVSLLACYAFPPVRFPAARRFPPLPDLLLFLLFLHVSQNQEPSGHTVNPIHDKWNCKKTSATIEQRNKAKEKETYPFAFTIFIIASNHLSITNTITIAVSPSIIIIPIHLSTFRRTSIRTNRIHAISSTTTTSGTISIRHIRMHRRTPRERRTDTWPSQHLIGGDA
jgi:hypothetical protein